MTQVPLGWNHEFRIKNLRNYIEECSLYSQKLEEKIICLANGELNVNAKTFCIKDSVPFDLDRQLSIVYLNYNLTQNLKRKNWL